MSTFYSVKYVETRGLESFKGTVLDHGRYKFVTSNAAGKKARRENLGTDCFESKAQAVSAGIDKLRKLRESLSWRLNRVTNRLGELSLEKRA
ncbi:MAG: hypothetical protein GY906_22345 [bacterium]|nr:hypothetical protein [bacterium]